jgi:uncharacterized protein
LADEWNKLLLRDHEITEKALEAGSRALAGPQPDRALVAKLVTYLSEYVERVHNKKEEDHLFPLLEKRGVPRQGGPLAVMLAEHDETKTQLEEFRARAFAYASGRGEISALKQTFGQLSDLLKNHYWKENDILYPMAQRVMTAADCEAVVAGILATEAAAGADTRAKYYALADEIIAAGEIKDLVYGLDYETIGAMLNSLPVELSFVDANDTVRYFSHENHDKIFPRTRGAIGMKVQNCHPQKSLHLVNRILADFKAGRREVAEFWIDMGPRRVHIRYWPVREAAGKYLGCVETVQDVSGIQKLKGERRLLDEA